MSEQAASVNTRLQRRHKQMETRPPRQLRNLSPTQSQTHLQFERAHTHTRVTHRMFGVQNHLPRVPFSRPSPRQLTDTQHSSIPPGVVEASDVRGARLCECVRVCAGLTQDPAGLPKLISGGTLLERVHEVI